MSVVIVGGHDRMHCRYKEICKKYGCKCKVFTQCPANFKSQIGNPDVVIVFTGTVAHKMVNLAAEQAQKTGAIIKHCNSSSACALNDALCECFSKRKCGIGLIVTGLKETTCHCLAMSVLLFNLRKIGKVLFTIFLSWFQKLLEIYNVSEMAIIQ